MYSNKYRSYHLGLFDFCKLEIIPNCFLGSYTCFRSRCTSSSYVVGFLKTRRSSVFGLRCRLD